MRRRPAGPALSILTSMSIRQPCGISPRAITAASQPQPDGMPAPGSAAPTDRKAPTPSNRSSATPPLTSRCADLSLSGSQSGVGEGLLGGGRYSAPDLRCSAGDFPLYLLARDQSGDR